MILSAGFVVGAGPAVGAAGLGTSVGLAAAGLVGAGAAVGAHAMTKSTRAGASTVRRLRYGITTYSPFLDADATAAVWVRDLGEGPESAAWPDVVGRRLLVRSTGAGQRVGYTTLVTNIPVTKSVAADQEPCFKARQTIEGWLSEATDALQLKGLWSRSFCGVEAFRLYVALASTLLNWWERRALLPASGLPHLGLRQLIGRVISLPARVLRAADQRWVLLGPPTRPYARRLVPTASGWQLPLPFRHHELAFDDVHF